MRRIFVVGVTLVYQSLIQMTSTLGQYSPVFENTRVLTCGDLSVEVMDPLLPTRQDRGVRFSPMAFIIQMNFKEIDYLYAPPGVTDMSWNSCPGKYPAGAPMEFDIGDYEIAPPGFDQTNTKQSCSCKEFIKIGVGILKNARCGVLPKSYSFSHDYSFADKTVNAVSWRTNGAAFVQSLPRVSDSGYRYELVTDLQVSEHQVEIDYQLTNCGRKTIVTSQYLHNFTRIGNQEVGTGYLVEVPWPFEATKMPPQQPVTQLGRSIAYYGPITLGNKLSIPIDHIGTTEYSIGVRQVEHNSGMTLSVDLPDEQIGSKVESLGVAVWSTDSTQISPEQFVRIVLEPDRTAMWTRTYSFDTGTCDTFPRVTGEKSTSGSHTSKDSNP